MAEVRKFDPSTGEGLQKLVREAIGETVRPFEPGAAGPGLPSPEPEAGEVGVADLDVAGLAFGTEFVAFDPEHP